VKRYITLMFILAFAVGFSSIASAEPTYVGVKKCKMCHMKQYKVWKNTKHAKAFSALKPEEQKDPKCNKCHTTGPNAKLENVQCEACHGPGSKYSKFNIMNRSKYKANKEAQRKLAIEAGLILPKEENCRKCHNKESPNYKEFNFKEYWGKIKHPL